MTETTEENARARFIEACNLARHYSTLRFVMFSVFITITGALVAIEFDSSRRPANGAPLIWFRFASLFLVLCFLVSEWRIGKLVVFYQKATYTFGSDTGYPQLSVDKPPSFRGWALAAPLLTSAPFAIAAILWIGAQIWFWGSPLWSVPSR